MRKGIVRIVFGIVMLCLQLISFIGNSNSGTVQSGNLLFTLLFYVGYLMPGVCGLVSLIFGIRAYNSGDTATLILHTNTNKHHRIIKYACVSLLSLNLLYLIFIHLIRDKYDFTVYLLLSLISLVLMFLYLTLNQGKKPSFLFSAAIVFVGIRYLYGILSNMSFTAIIYFAIGILYILIGEMLYKEKFSPKRVRVMGAIAFALEMVMVIYYRSMWWAFIPFIIDIILPSTIFAYTCIVPVYSMEEK